MKEFTQGLDFQLYYWYDEYAVCLNVAWFTTTTEFNIITAVKLETCSRTIVKCLDNWDNWTDEEELLLGECTQSSSEDITVYQFKPWEADDKYYLFGNDTYNENYCWPGKTPFYSPFMKYPNNPLWAIVNSFYDLTYSFDTARTI